MSPGICPHCGYTYAAHRGVDCQPHGTSTAAEMTRLRVEIARLEAKHRRFAAETNRIITEQHREITRLREQSA